MVRRAAEALFPRRCAGCDGDLPTSDLPLVPFCAICTDALRPFAAGGCQRCGAGPDEGEPPRRGPWRCRACRLSPPPYARALGFWAYGGPLRDAVLRWKNRPALHLSAPLGDLYLHGFDVHFGRALPTPERVVPVPPSPSRLRHRGFNPPALLAERLAGYLRDRGVSTRLAPSALAFRRGDPVVSRNAPRAIRLRRAGDAFVADPRAVEGRTVWLVDDVMTTGATVHGAAAALLAAGAARVEVGVLCRVPGPRLAQPQPPGSSSHEKAARSAWTPSSFRKSQSF